MVSSVLKCHLFSNRAEERIILHSDDNGNLIGFDHFTTNSFCDKNQKNKKNKNSLPKTLEKSVQVSMSFGDKGDSPYLPEYEIAPPKKEEKSFWSRYWWIILIVGFVILQSVAAGAAQQ